MKIHYLAAVIVISRLLFPITRTEWMILLIVIGSVMSLEMVNTAVENSRFRLQIFIHLQKFKGCCGRSGFIVCNYSCYNWCYYLFTVYGIVAFRSFYCFGSAVRGFNERVPLHSCEQEGCGNMNSKQLILEAIEARKQAYVPYSKFQVGATINARWKSISWM